MRLGFSILLAVLAVLFAGRIGLAEPVRVSSLEAKANEAVAELKAALASERKTREEQALLANRIAALKRDPSSQDSALLERLLRESIDADRALAAQIKATRRAVQSVSQAVEQIDARINSSRPLLNDESKPTASRKQAAKEILELGKVKGRLAQLLAALKRGEPHREWADHVVAIDPLDGPEELADKADVLALTQKKIEQKKALLDRLIREKKVSQAARDFAVAATALDEEIRSGRVNRGGPGTRGTTEDIDLNAGADNRAPPPAAPAEGAFQSPGAEADDQAAAPPLDPSRDTNLGATQPTVGVAGRKAVEVNPPAALPQIAVPKQIDPNVLINLRVEELDADSVPLATLEKYIAELESMQKALATQQQKLKSRSQQLQKDELRTKSK